VRRLKIKNFFKRFVQGLSDTYSKRFRGLARYVVFKMLVSEGKIMALRFNGEDCPISVKIESISKASGF